MTTERKTTTTESVLLEGGNQVRINVESTITMPQPEAMKGFFNDILSLLERKERHETGLRTILSGSVEKSQRDAIAQDDKELAKVLGHAEKIVDTSNAGQMSAMGDIKFLIAGGFKPEEGNEAVNRLKEILT